MATISSQEFFKSGGVRVVGNEQSVQEDESKNGATFFQRVGQDISQGFKQAKVDVNNPDSNRSALSKGVAAVSDIAGAVMSPVSEAPGFKQVGELFSKGINLAGEQLAKLYSPEFKASLANMTPEQYQQATQPLQDLANAGNIANTILLAKGGQKGTQLAKNTTSNLKNKINDILPPDGGAGAITTIKSMVVPDSAGIMNRVARLKPTDATKFENLAGQSHGDYLAKTGNFGSPDKIISTEAIKFAQTITAKDGALAKLPGLYKDGSITDALQGLLEKAKSTSGENIKSPYLSQVESWVAKNKSTGLTMEDINNVKRLYEKEVKLGYNKLTNGDKVAQATNIDSALRKFQDTTAKNLGFTNLPELNKQIQLSKFIIDKLGDQIVGKNGLNSIGLTDWVILAGGDPTAVGAFLTKKFFSSKGVQSKIAEMLSKGETKATPVPNTVITPENINRSVNPQGFKALNAPKEGSPQKQIDTPINQPSRKAIEQGTEIVPKTSSSQSQSVLKTKVRKASPKSTTKGLKVKGETPKQLEPLLQEAKKYKSAEEFVSNYKNNPKIQAIIHQGETPEVVKIKDLFLSEDTGTAKLGFGKGIEAKNLTPGRKVEEPILVLGKNTVIDGHTRIQQAIANGEDTVKIYRVKPSSEVKSQLTDIWNKAHKK